MSEAAGSPRLPCPSPLRPSLPPSSPSLLSLPSSFLLSLPPSPLPLPLPPLPLPLPPPSPSLPPVGPQLGAEAGPSPGPAGGHAPRHILAGPRRCRRPPLAPSTGPGPQALFPGGHRVQRVLGFWEGAPSPPSAAPSVSSSPAGTLHTFLLLRWCLWRPRLAPPQLPLSSICGWHPTRPPGGRTPKRESLPDLGKGPSLATLSPAATPTEASTRACLGSCRGLHAGVPASVSVAPPRCPPARHP